MKGSFIMSKPIRNRIMFSTPFDKGEFKKKFFSENNLNEVFFDFNNLIPLPKELILAHGIISDIALCHYRGIPSPHLKRCLNLITPELFKSEFEWSYDSSIDGYTNVVEYMSEEVQKIIKENKGYTQYEALLILHDIGKILDDNITKYGFPTWYEWCLFNWGTEWLPSNGDIYDNTLMMVTKDKPPFPIYRKLCYLGYNFTVEYADDAGHNCGIITACDCNISQTDYEENSMTARDICNDLWGPMR